MGTGFYFPQKFFFFLSLLLQRDMAVQRGKNGYTSIHTAPTQTHRLTAFIQSHNEAVLTYSTVMPCMQRCQAAQPHTTHVKQCSHALIMPSSTTMHYPYQAVQPRTFHAKQRSHALSMPSSAATQQLCQAVQPRTTHAKQCNHALPIPNSATMHFPCQAAQPRNNCAKQYNHALIKPSSTTSH